MTFSAGILLYRRTPSNLYVLLGKDTKYNLWSDFGGKSESTDNGDPINTASREFYEETSGSIYDVCELRYHLKKRSICFECDSYRKRKYYMFLMNTENILNGNVCEKFRNQQIMLANIMSDNFMKFKEKQDIQWFSFNYILDNRNIFREVFFNSIMKHFEDIQSA